MRNVRALAGLVAFFLALGLVSTGASTGDSWSCAATRWNGWIHVSTYPDRIVLSSNVWIDGYPYYSVGPTVATIYENSVTVDCPESSADPAVGGPHEWVTGDVSCAVSPPGPILLHERVQGGIGYIIIQQNGMSILKLKKNPNLVNRVGFVRGWCPAPGLPP